MDHHHQDDVDSVLGLFGTEGSHGDFLKVHDSAFGEELDLLQGSPRFSHRLNDTLLDETTALQSGLSAVSTSDDEVYHNEDTVDGETESSLQDNVSIINNRKRKHSMTDYSQSNKLQRTDVVVSSGDVYVVDGEPVPRLQLGESGRAQLKSSISSVLKVRTELRKRCNSIQKVKNASIMQLLTMAKICGIWDQAVKISESFLKKYPCRRAVVSDTSSASLDEQVVKVGEMGLMNWCRPSLIL